MRCDCAAVEHKISRRSGPQPTAVCAMGAGMHDYRPKLWQIHPRAEEHTTELIRQPLCGLFDHRRGRPALSHGQGASTNGTQTIRKYEMRKVLIIALGLASLGALAAAQPAFPRASGQSLPVFCGTKFQKCKTDKQGNQFCSIQLFSCLQPSQLSSGASGPGPAPDPSQRRNIRPN